MIPTDEQLATCQSKRNYPSRMLADNTAWLINLARYASGKTLRSYRCDWCGDFHLTSKGAHS